MTAILITSMGLYLAPIHIEARAAQVPADVLLAICYHETRGEPDPANAPGLDGEVGLCQVLPETAADLGYRGTPEGLKVPRINIRYAARWLAHCMSKGAEAVRQLAHCYNEGRFTDTSKTAYSGRIAQIVVTLRMEAAITPKLALR